MNVASFFDRSATAVAQVLGECDSDRLRLKLSGLAVALAFDSKAVRASEGVVTLELATDLLARFYPGLRLIPVDDDPATVAMVNKLGEAARAIHPGIELQPEMCTVCCCLIVGSRAPALDVPTIFIGSHGWNAMLDPAQPVGSLDTRNPFGAAAAACIGVANAFRIAFADLLPDTRPDGALEFDVLHHRLGRCPVSPALPDQIDIDGTHLVGLGAIGRAAAWSLSRAPALRGRLDGVDHEAIEDSNLQRYVGATQADAAATVLKCQSVTEMFRGSGVQVAEHPLTWGQYLRSRADCRLDRVAVALDTPDDRIALQAALPRRILNAWTQPGDLGVSRHGFTSGPCLACLYLPDREVPSLSHLVADAIRLPELEVRGLLHAGFRVDPAFLERVALAAEVPLEALLPFDGLPLRSFYTKAVCGTTWFGTGAGGDRGAMAVPMAFQSALAGVLLAVEIVADAAMLRTTAMAPLTKINLLKPLGSRLVEPAAKHKSGQCICQDDTYRAAYQRKYS
jgi:hypothetical protein